MKPTTHYLVFTDDEGFVAGTAKVADSYSLTDEAVAQAERQGLAVEVHAVFAYGYEDAVLSGQDLLDTGAEILAR